LLGGESPLCVGRDDDINLERHEFGRERGEPLLLSISIALLDHEVAALDVSGLTQPLNKVLVHALGTIMRWAILATLAPAAPR